MPDVIPTGGIEKHYYSRDPATLALAMERAANAADLGYRSKYHAHRYGNGEVPCNKACRLGRPTDQTATLGSDGEEE